MKRKGKCDLREKSIGGGEVFNQKEGKRKPRGEKKEVEWAGQKKTGPLNNAHVPYPVP